MRGAVYHGWFYRTFVDPALVPVRDLVKSHVPEGSSVIDIGCGTGAQLLSLSDRILRGYGVDASEAQVGQARRQATRHNYPPIEFVVADARRLHGLRDGDFDIAMACMVLHEMPKEIRLPVLQEMRRVSRRILIVDWEAKQRTIWRTVSTHVVERLAGKEHYRGFRSFTATGGIPALLENAGLSALHEQPTAKGTMRLWVCG